MIGIHAPDDGRQPKAILASLEARGVMLALDGDNLRRVAGELTSDDKADLKACKVEILILLRARDPAPSPVIDAKSLNSYLIDAKTKFGDLWADLDKASPEHRRAAFVVLADAVAMLADAVAGPRDDEVKRQAEYVGWLCGRVQERIRAA